MKCFIKKVWEGNGEEVHDYFIRFSKGQFENRAALTLQKSTKIKLRGSFEWANDFVKMVSENLQDESVEQYKREERSAIARRLKGAQDRMNDLLEREHETMKADREEIQRILKTYLEDQDINVLVNTISHIIENEGSNK